MRSWRMPTAANGGCPTYLAKFYNMQRPSHAQPWRSPQRQASSSRRPRTSHPSERDTNSASTKSNLEEDHKVQRLEKAHSHEEDHEERRKQGSGSAANGGDEGAPGVLGVSSGTSHSMQQQPGHERHRHRLEVHQHLAEPPRRTMASQSGENKNENSTKISTFFIYLYIFIYIYIYLFIYLYL